MAVASTGAGAWLDGRRLSVAPPVDAGSMSGSLSIRFGNRHLVRRIAGRSDLVGSVFSFRCAGHEYLALASGRAHFALYHRLMPWDHAPGFLLHREAGGFGRRLDRSAYSPRTHDGGLLLTPDEASWEELYAVLLAK
jgi:fructose-1,6-bisphosphatase/inositol monophosphatase family enzyme